MFYEVILALGRYFVSVLLSIKQSKGKVIITEEILYMKPQSVCFAEIDRTCLGVFTVHYLLFILYQNVKLIQLSIAD